MDYKTNIIINLLPLAPNSNGLNPNASAGNIIITAIFQNLVRSTTDVEAFGKTTQYKTILITPRDE